MWKNHSSLISRLIEWATYICLTGLYLSRWPTLTKCENVSKQSWGISESVLIIITKEFLSFSKNEPFPPGFSNAHMWAQSAHNNDGESHNEAEEKIKIVSMESSMKWLSDSDKTERKYMYKRVSSPRSSSLFVWKLIARAESSTCNDNDMESY